MNIFKKWYKIIIVVIGAILIGAIGSGVWEHLLKPTIKFISYSTVKILSLISSNFKDEVYVNASYGFNEEYSMKTYFLLVFGIIYIILVVTYTTRRTLKRYIDEKNENITTEGIRSPTKKRLILLLLLFITATSLMFFLQAQDLYSHRVTTWSLSSVERVRGKITEEEYKTLRSKFFLVDSAKDYYEFYDELLQLAKENNIKLRPFNPL